MDISLALYELMPDGKYFFLLAMMAGQAIPRTIQNDNFCNPIKKRTFHLTTPDL